MDTPGQKPSDHRRAAAPGSPARRIVLILRVALAVVVIIAAAQMLLREFGALSAADIGDDLSRIGLSRLALMTLASAAAFLCVATYDGFALRYARRELAFRRSALSSLTSYAISNMLGFAIITGNAVRYWLFGRWGLGSRDVAIAAVATTIVSNFALTLLVGAALLISPTLVSHLTGLGAFWTVLAGVTLVAVCGVLIFVGVAGPRTLRLGGFSIARPGKLLLAHLCVCLIDYPATAAVLYIPLAETLGMGFPDFIVLFSAAKLVGIASNIPGGLGVFEAVMAFSMANATPSAVAASLIAYRLVFYLGPFLIALFALAAVAARGRRPSRSKGDSSPPGR